MTAGSSSEGTGRTVAKGASQIHQELVVSNEAHIRIDEGLKRGPKLKVRKPRVHGTAGQPALYPHRLEPRPGEPVNPLTVIPPDLDPDQVLERYLTETTTSLIAQEYGVSRRTLTRWLTQQRPDQWRQVQLLRAICRKEDADEKMEIACDALALARAREQLRSGQWDLERLDPNTWAQRQQISVKNEPLAEKDIGLLESARELLVLFKTRQAQAEKLPEKVVDPDPNSTV